MKAIRGILIAFTLFVCMITGIYGATYYSKTTMNYVEYYDSGLTATSKVAITRNYTQACLGVRDSEYKCVEIDQLILVHLHFQ